MIKIDKSRIEFFVILYRTYIITVILGIKKGNVLEKFST